MNYKEFKEKEFRDDPELLEEYKALEPEYEIIKQIILASHEKNLTQEELAKRVGMTQSNLSRIESGRSSNLTLNSIKRIAKEVGKTLKIEFV